MKRTIGLLLVAVMCIGLFSGCGEECYVGKWTSTVMREEGGEETDFGEKYGYQEILTFNANGTFECERISVDPEQYPQEMCDEWNQEFKDEYPDAKWKYVTKDDQEGITIWSGDKEPDDDASPEFITEDGYIYDGSTRYES